MLQVQENTGIISYVQLRPMIECTQQEIMTQVVVVADRGHKSQYYIR